MNVRDLINLYEYSHWANKTLFDVISRLPPEQFTQTVAGSYQSIRNTLIHAISAEWGWLDRCGGPERGPRLNPDDYPTLESVIAVAARVDGYVQGFLGDLKDDDLFHEAKYTNDLGHTLSMPMGELLHHAANHSVHHRGQAALLLRILGCDPGYVDLLVYYAEKRGVPPW